MPVFSASAKSRWRERFFRHDNPLVEQAGSLPQQSSPSNTDTAREKPASQSASAFLNAVYYPNWRVYRQQPPSSLNLSYITHIFYAFAWPGDDGVPCLSDSYADVEIDINGVKGALCDLKRVKMENPHIKTLLSIGGGGRGSKNFSMAARNVSARGMFAQRARQLVDMHAMDGIDIDWEHPSTPHQGEDYIELLKKLRTELPSPRYLLTSALPAGQWALTHINLEKASAPLDFINLMTYDFAGPWTSSCGHHAQLHSPKRPYNDAARTSCSSAIEYVVSQGVPAHKVLMGIPTYGRSFIGSKKVGDAFSGHAGEEGTFEYRYLPRPGSKLLYDECLAAAYCVGADGGFVSYDDQRTVQAKARFVKQQRLGGVFYWTGTADTNDERSLVKTGWDCLHASN
ncbi:MAG: hypothetical protein Q9217_005241 [Psora testacea]